MKLDLPEGEMRGAALRCLPCVMEDNEIEEASILELSQPPSQANKSAPPVLNKPFPFFDEDEEKLDVLKKIFGLVDVDAILPEDLDWSDSTRIPTVFVNYDVQRGRGRNMPQCIIRDAEGDFDKCLLCIWWFKLNKKERTEAFEDLKKIYRAPSKSNSPKKGTSAQAAAAKNAARAAGNAAASADAEEYVGIADSYERRAEAAKNSYSYKNTKAASKNPKIVAPDTALHMRRRDVRRIEGHIEEQLLKHQAHTKPIPGCPARNDIVSFQLTNVKDAYMRGRSKNRCILNGQPDPWLDDTRPILNIIAAKEDVLLDIVGGHGNMGILEEKYQVHRFFAGSDQELLPSRINKNKAKQATGKTPERGRKTLAEFNAANEEGANSDMEEEDNTPPVRQRRGKRKRTPSGKKKLTLDNFSP